MKPALYLVPNLLGAVPPDHVLPARTLDIARSLVHWVVETPKAARAFLKSLDAGRPIRDLAVDAIGEAPSPAALQRLLAPIAAGGSVGLLSDAGCPGIADPGALLVAHAHASGVEVVPLVGPSSILLALMAAGMNGQRFAFHGYLPVKPDARATQLRRLEADAIAGRGTQIFIETPYRNAQVLAAIVATLAASTRVCVAVDLTLPSESVRTLTVERWRGVDAGRYDKRPALFLVDR